MVMAMVMVMVNDQWSWSISHHHNIDQVEELSLHLPPRCLGSTWTLAYTTDQHGHQDYDDDYDLLCY